MSVRRGSVHVLLVGVLLTLTACAGGTAGRARPGASVQIDVTADGGAQVDVFARGWVRTDAELTALAEALARDLFPGARGIRARMIGGGDVFARARVAGAYRPGKAAEIRIDTAAAARRLSGRGFTEVGLRLYLPSVPATVRSTASGSRFWRLRRGEPTPQVRVVMRPQPLRWYGAMALPVLAAAGLVVGLVRRRRRGLAVSGGAVAAGAAAATLMFSAGRQGDNLGVAGTFAGRALDVATSAPLAALPLGLAGAILVIAAELAHRRGARREGVLRPPLPVSGAGR